MPSKKEVPKKKSPTKKDIPKVPKVKSVAVKAAKAPKVIDKPESKSQEFVRAVGRRKSAVARVRLYPKGKGKIQINDKDFKQYFSYFELNQKITAPLKVVGKMQDFDFTIKVKGGGQLGQAQAVCHGIARALVKFNQDDYKKILRANGFLTRDPRVKERKKPGLKKARRAPQWSKR